jgi:hypothetical protein
MPLVELLESAHIFAKKVMHQRRVRRHFVVPLRRESRQEHVYASSAPEELYVKFWEMDGFGGRCEMWVDD